MNKQKQTAKRKMSVPFIHLSHSTHFIATTESENLRDNYTFDNLVFSKLLFSYVEHIRVCDDTY